jgi:hypothetical protein
MAAVEPVADPFREAKEATNAAYQAIIQAKHAIQQPELDPRQRQALVESLVSAIEEFREDLKAPPR